MEFLYIVRMLSKSYVDPNSSIFCILCHMWVFFYHAFGRSCIRIVNKIGAIIDPCGMSISIFLINESVFPTRVLMHRSDKTFLMHWNIVPVIPTFFSY